jgi:hypothetical protein
MWHHIHQIAVNTGRIADALEAIDKRAVADHAVGVHLDLYPPEVQELIARLLIPGVTVREPSEGLTSDP